MTPTKMGSREMDASSVAAALQNVSTDFCCAHDAASSYRVIEYY